MLNATMLQQDLQEQQLVQMLRRLQKFAVSLFWQAVPFSINGILRHRWRIKRWPEQWKYALPLAVVPWDKNWVAIDVGSAASLTTYYLASQGCTVTTIDEDPELAESTRKFSQDKALPLSVIEKSPLLYEVETNEKADWVLCICYLENITYPNQMLLCKKLADFLKKGGILTLIFQYGDQAPAPYAPHRQEDVQLWVEYTGLRYFDDKPFEDRGKRYPIDPWRPDREFTYGSLLLVKK